MAKRSASAIVNDPSFWESGDDESIDRDSDVEDADFIIPIEENSSDSDNDSTADFDSSTSRPGSKPIDGYDEVNFSAGILTENAEPGEIDDYETENENEVEVNRGVINIIPEFPAQNRQQWTQNIHNPPDIRFSQAVGVNNFDEVSRKSEVELFYLFFTDYLLRDIVIETNRYAAQCRQQPPRKGEKHPEWKDLTVPEFKAWIGLVLASGIVQKKGRLADYWAKHWLLQTPGFNKTMTSRRFLQILAYLHFVDNMSNTVDKSDKLWKVDHILQYLIKRFQEIYQPSRQLAVDETMLKFKGRLKIKQYIKIKPVKWGIKLFTLAESTTGYVLNIIPYTGMRGDTTFSKTAQTVLDISEPYLHKGHILFMDNYYTSIELMEELQSRRTLSCGTVNSNRKGLPLDMKPKCDKVKKLKRGESLKRMKGNILAITWKDTRAVNLLTNIPDSITDIMVSRRDKFGTVIDISKPKAIDIYNTFMGGVDLSDQLVSTYRRHMKSQTWYLQIFFHLLRLSVVQAFLLHKKINTSSKLSQKDFFVKVIDGLIGGRTYTSRQGRPSTCPVANPDSRFNRELDHSPFKFDTQSKCIVHTNRVDTSFGCSVCKVRMCPHPCFHRYHYITHYKFDDPAKLKKRKVTEE